MTSTHARRMRASSVGASFRAVRLRRRMRQSDVAAASGVSRSFVSLIERGHVERASLETLQRVADVLEIRLNLTASWRGGDLERLLNADHSALHESVAEWLSSATGWEFAQEVSFNIYGERGVIDIL